MDCDAVIIHPKGQTWKVLNGFRFNRRSEAETYHKHLDRTDCHVVTEQDLDGFFSSRFLAVPEHIKCAFYNYREYGG